jgi:hypothetical protein
MKRAMNKILTHTLMIISSTLAKSSNQVMVGDFHLTDLIKFKQMKQNGSLRRS